MILGTAGHIDHGKTALVTALTGVDTDRLVEEKRRGITIELGFAPLDLPGVGIMGVVDVPGHEGFVRTMLAGATGVDLALLAIAADEGVMPQTREHLAILSLLGIRSGVIALTKSDLVDREWLDLVADDVRKLVSSSSLADAPIVPTSIVSGTGLDELKAAIANAVTAIPERDASDIFRMPIDRAFSAKGTGTIVTGTVWSGTVREDSILFVMPAGAEVRVRGIQAHGRVVREGRAGTRAAIALAGVHPSLIDRGQVLVDSQAWHSTTMLLARVALLEDTVRTLKPREWIRLHHGTFDVAARVVAPGGQVCAGEQRSARILLDQPVALRGGDRFVLRRGSPPQTIGGGIVLDPMVRNRRAKPWPTVMVGGAPHLDRLALTSETTGVEIDQLPVRLGITSADIKSLLGTTSSVEAIGTRVFHRTVIAAVRDRMLTGLTEYHARNPLSFGMHSAEWRRTVGGDVPMLAAVERRLMESGEVEFSGPLVRVRGWQPQVDAGQRQRLESLRGRIERVGLEARSLRELEEGFGSETGRLLRILMEEGAVVQLDKERVVARTALQSAQGTLCAGMEKEPEREFTASELRELLGVSRKYVIPLLEWFDRVGVTERRTAGRVLRRA